MTIQILWCVLAVMGMLIMFDIWQQSRDVWDMLRCLRRGNQTPVESNAAVALPPAVIILALRGPDPRLAETLEALMVQDYPSFHIQVVVDSEEDPVLRKVTEIQKMSMCDKVRVSVLSSPARTCSLKCSSLIQAVSNLESSVEILAFIDGDVVPHPTWLKELATPLVKGEADVVGGNRWYLPPNARFGTMARYFWNAAYMTGMCAQGAPWAGTMAFKRSTASRIRLLEAWSTAMSVDATVHRCMRAEKLTFKLVASLIMTNRENISLGEFQRWVTRQMAVIRYTSPQTAKSAEQQIGILLLLHTGLPAIAVTSFLMGQMILGLTAVAAIAFYWLVCSLRMILIERTIRVTIRKRGEAPDWLTPLTILLWYPGVIVAHYVIAWGVLGALRATRVDWRGVSYLISKNGVVQMDTYRPFAADWVKQKNHSTV
jgi:hypothetical protein